MKPWTIYPTETDHPKVELDDTGGDILIIGGIHGDEPCGWTAIREFYRENYADITKPITFLFANPFAAQQRTRYLDADLNRLFGGEYDPELDAHEMNLASDLQPIIPTFEVVVSLHSTQSTNEPFALFGPPVSKSVLELLSRVGISKAINIPQTRQRGALISFPNVVEFECGFQHSEDAIQNAKRIISNSVAYIDGLSSESPRPQNDVRIFELVNTVPKPESEIKLHIDNLQTVEKGELVAETDSQKFFAPQSFAPILMSENGYSDILGYRGVEKGWLSSAVLQTHMNRPEIITEVRFEPLH